MILYNSHIIANNIKAVAKSRKISLKTLFDECGMGRNAMSHMTNGSMPKADNLAKIADYLDCSVDFLLGRDTRQSITVNNAHDNIGVVGQANAPVTIHNGTERQLSAQAQDLLQIYNNANGKTQHKIMDFVYGLEEKKK